MTGGFDYGELNSVEQYDYYEKHWTYLPDMIEKRCDHAAVSMGNKMFVIGGSYTSTCETFDSFSRKFTFIKSIKLTKHYDSCYKAVCIGQTFVAFSIKPTVIQTEPYDTKVFVYDTSKDQWSEKECSVLKNLAGISCVKYYEE